MCKLPVILSSDSHGKEHVGDFTYAEEFVHQLMFPETLILNNQQNKQNNTMQKTLHKIKECPFEEHSFNVSEGKLLIWEAGC